MPKSVGRGGARGTGRRIKTVNERVARAEGEGRGSLATRRAKLFAAIQEIDPGMASAVKREEKRCGSELFDDKSVAELANRATTASSMAAFEAIAAESDIFAEGAQKYLDAAKSADAAVAAAPEGAKALDLDFFTGKDGIAKVAVDKDGKLDEAGSAVVRMVGRKHAKSMTTDALTFMTDFNASYQADLQSAKIAEEGRKQAQQFLDSENQAALTAWEQDRSTAEKIRDENSNFNQKIENVKARAEVHLEVKDESKEARQELKVEKAEVQETDESHLKQEVHHEVKGLEDDSRDGAGRVTQSTQGQQTKKSD
jgi:hypothetical protein